MVLQVKSDKLLIHVSQNAIPQIARADSFSFELTWRFAGILYQLVLYFPKEFVLDSSLTCLQIIGRIQKVPIKACRLLTVTVQVSLPFIS